MPSLFQAEQHTGMEAWDSGLQAPDCAMTHEQACWYVPAPDRKEMADTAEWGGWVAKGGCNSSTDATAGGWHPRLEK